MTANKSKVFPIIITMIILVIIIYLFVNIKQKSFACYKRVVDNNGIIITEDIKVSLDGSKIGSMELVKSFTIPNDVLTDSYLESLKYTFKKSYAYLNKDVVRYSILNNRLIIHINVEKNETLILNNISFNEDLSVNINSNTKSSDVVALKIGDNYTVGQLSTHLKTYGYVCS